MAKRLNFRQDNIDYKELLKRREEKRKKLATKKNPFILSVSETDHETYSKLYKFNPDEILNEFNKGGGSDAVVKTNQSDKKASLSMSKSRQTETKSPNKSKISEKIYREQEEFEMDDQQIFEGDEYENGENGEFEEGDESKYTQIVQNLFNEKMKKPVNKIQNALFVDQYVAAELAKIVTGEQAISFFAKYGNTTPIKFINCVKDDQHKPEEFKPYDLKVNNVSENQKELTLDEYYTISAHGIVHVFTAKGKKALGNSDTSTEVISLSDWMHESTMFNIITNIQFFKNYAITKIFNIWKANVHYRIFCKTRKKLIHDTFIAKPAFANHLMSINQHMYEIQNTKTVSNSIVQSKIWDQEEFKQDQKKARQEAQRNYESIVEKVITLVEVVCKEVDQRTKIKEQSEIEEARFGQQVKSKPRYEIALEAKERAYLLERAIKDREKLRNFIRLVDYLCVETLVHTNLLSMHTLLEEMKKERKQGLFGSTVIFDIAKMSFSPDEKEVTDSLVKLLEDMVNTMQSSSLRVIHHFESYIKNLSTENICDVAKIIFDSVEFQSIKEEVLVKISTDFRNAQNYVDEKYEKCRPVHNFKTEWNFEAFKAEEQRIETVKQRITELNKWLLDIQHYIKDVVQGVVQIQGSKIKSNLDDFVKKQLELIRVYLYDQMKRKAEQLYKQLQQYNGNLSKPPSNTLKDYATYINFYNEVLDAAKDSKLEKKKQEIEEMHYELKIKFTNISGGGSTNTNDELLLENIQNEYQKIGKSVKEADASIKENQASMIKKLENDYQKLIQDIKQTALSVNQPILCSEETSSSQALNLLQTIKIQIEGNQNKTGGEYGGLQGKYRNLHYYASLMQFNLQETRDLKELEAKYNDRFMLWSHYDEFQTKEDEWKKNPFNQLNSEDVEKDMRKYKQGIAKLKMNIHNLTTEEKDRVLESYDKKYKSFETNMPIIIALGNKDLQVRHWKKIFDILQLPISPGQTFTLLDLMSSNATEKIEEMEEISGRASGEAGIERQVDEIKKKWQELAFIVMPYRDYKDKFILGTVEDIIASLDDHQLKVQTMLGTKYVTEIRPVVEDWEKKLVLISDIIDEWLYCQRQWMYLENIFSAEDIQKQLPQETTKFMQVDKFWKETMLKTNKRPLVQDCCSNEDLLKKFQMFNKMLEDIQKCLENYLETKRAAFPRFYFLSNDELLEILSQTRNPHAVQSHLRKCFDNINRIQFTEEEESKEIVGMQSAEPEIMPEKVPFFASVFAEGAVEHWLYRIQEMMIKTLHDITKKALLEYPENGLERREWLFKYPAQPILTVDQIKWTQGCTEAIIKMSEGKMTGLSEYNEFMRVLIDRMVDIVRGQLNTLERTLMGALIVIDVHARDVVSTMTQMNISQLNDFEWSKQLRYYWEVEEDNCFVKQTNTRFKYRFEYLGNGPRLVITPLTDKCYITLTSAKYLSYGGAPAGPAGTGKTETTKDLAKALAVQCVVFNCSDGLDFKTMGRFFSGLAQSGAWACFDEFNRIDIEVLSVIAQQILTIQVAIRRDVDTFEFEGRTIPLDQNFGVFITMNPGYAGRTELPDNLKALFRPVAMMIPDYRLIAEIILFSEGFSTASVLARKMVNLYKLSSEQLSKQDHYDFGMRAVKSVLVMAGALRRKEAQLSEDIVLIRAMRDSNVPKFLEHDLPLFMSIISDLFPGVDIPYIDYGNLQKAIENQLELQNYQKPAKFITKIIQLMETIMVRHGVMVVGITGTGKTTNIHTLAKSMHQLEKEGSTDYYHKQVKLERLNPKSVTMNELFGYTNILTNEWTDGIAAKIIRDNVAEGTDLKKWIIFDGPVDALWIENMNTVLDDNKMLCLNNGQRIKLPATFTMMFEVQDLAVASPATVSRCGMVYMEPVHLGWEPILDTWCIKFKEHVHKDKEGKSPQYVTTLVEKIRNFFKDNFKFLRNDCKEIIPTVDNNLVQSCLNFVEIVYQECAEVHNFEKMTNNESEHLCSMIFIFSFIWSTGGNLHDSSRQKFSQTIKGKILKILSGFPFDGEVFDYYINIEKKEFKPWTELITEFKFNLETPYFNILVPTADTVKYKNILSKLLKNNRNVLLSGETGTGKSVIIQEFLISLSQDHFVNSVLNFSAQTKSQNLQDLFMDKDKFQRKKKDLLGPPAGKKMIVFIDDVNMPALEQYGAQPPNELLRQIIDQGGFYDLKKLYFMNIKDCNFIVACGPPDGGRNPVTPRLFRHFNMLWAPELSQRSMETIFMHILKGFLAESPYKGLDKLAPQIVKTTIDMYLNMKQKFLPTPKKCHYTFNLRDISKVFQGILQVKFESCQDKEMLLSLWAHECQRVFADRLVDDQDKSAFLEYLVTPLNEHFQLEWDKPHLSSILFGDYANNQRLYIKIEENFTKLGEKLNRDYLQHYNNTNTQKQMNLVFFQDALMHLTRICRIIRQPRGNSLLIGVGGSGRQSLTRMATFICQYNCFSIEIAKNYKEPQWKDDLKKLLKNAGAKNTPQVFLFSDTQIVMESFLEDINNILNTGEVPNLWAPEDLEEIIGEMRPLVKEAKIDETRDKMLKYFVQLVRENLHIVLTFSPVGDKLRNRCRQFPSIINCCGIDWFDKWPEDALQSVADSQYRAQDKLGIQDYIQNLSDISVIIHQSVQDKSVEFYEQLRRHNYVTPTSYLELIKLYIEMMKEQQGILPMKIQKYTVGLQTLDEANKEVANLQQKIIAFQPELERSAKENAILVKEIEGKKEIAAVEQEKCKQETDAAQIIRDDVNSQRQVCKKELDEALPILEQANNAVKKIDKKMTDEMKSFKQPPAMVGVVMNAVCLLFNEKEDWDSAKKLLGNMKFLDSLVEFKPETVPEKRWQKLRANYLNDPNFTKEKVSNISLAATSLLIWVLAIEKFAKVQKIVAPKEAALKEAEAKLKVVEAQLYEKESALREIQEMVQDLEKKYEMSVRKAEMLKQQKQTAEIQLNRAEKLVSGLAGESERWKISKKMLEDDFQNIVGNMILAAASIAYLGPFVFNYRKELLQQWIQECIKLQIPVAKDFSLQRILTEEVQIREWQENGLPADDLSIENGIFIFNCKRWPLVIDPQGQANRWIKNLGADNNLQTTKLTEPNFLKTLENSIRFGQPVLLENIEEDLDPALEPILLKQTFKKNGQQTLRLGDQDIPYNKDFKFYMTTKLPNPHYIPEICIKTTIINFTVTPQGLEDQLLVEVVRHEEAQLEEKRVSLIISVSQDKRQLQELEDRILKLISEAQAQNKILEDEELINTLDQSKTTSQTVNQRIEQSKKTQQEINQTRELYRPIAKRGSVLYFVIAGLSNIDPMYQYSLEFFIKLFKLRLDKAENPPELSARLAALLEDITRSFYINICRGLFEKDKLLFSFLISTSINLEGKAINVRDWNYFIKGPSQEPQIDESQIPTIFTHKQFIFLTALSDLGLAYKPISPSLQDSSDRYLWNQIMESKDPWKCQFPDKLQNLDPFQKMLLLKQIREEKLITFVRYYVHETLGELFTKSPLFDLKGSFADSTCTTPIIFVLSPGADPIAYLYQLAKEKDFDQRLKSLSLGQGQGEIAKEMIKTGRRNGDWVCLQNCHLAVSWMTELERIQEMQVEADTHPEYRLWLTSMPSTKFPVPVLQSGIKLTNEPPKGLKANLGRTFNEVDEKEYEGCTKRTEYQKLLFSLGFFHAVILERRKFGAIGWNIPYEWMNSDFETCQKQLMIYLNEQPEIPWETLNYLISEINYGGRVTDDKDVRLITALLRKYFNPKIMGEKFDFSQSGMYHTPTELQLSAVRGYIDSFPTEDDPEVFGLHTNANITFEQKTVKEFFDTLLLGQPRSTGKSASGETPDDIVFKLADKILNEIPDTLDQVRVENPNSLDVFRYQEVLQFNRLVSTIKKTLAELKKAIKGLVVMSITLEKMFDSFLLKRVPANWEKVAYPSLKPLGSWVADLSQRVEFFRSWVKNGIMPSYWISAMFFPQGFMTSALQTYARKTHIAIDTLTFKTDVRNIKPEECTEVPDIGVNVHGLFVEGCGWNVQKAILQESQPKILFVEMPVIWLEPVKIESYNPKSVYKCPLYKTSTRRGTLSTTGHSTNFVMYMDLKTEEEPDHWIRRGVALLCLLDD